MRTTPPLKQTARKMVLMVRVINQANFGGKPEVTCYSCHRNSNRPKVIPSLAEPIRIASRRSRRCGKSWRGSQP